MNHADSHSILFRGVISQLNDLYGHEGSSLADSRWSGEFSFSTAFQPRPSQNFAHNYERDKFLHNRDRFVLLNTGDVSMVAVKATKHYSVTMYREPFKVASPTHHEKFTSILEKLLTKFYDEVVIEDWLALREVDLSTGRNPNRHRVHYEV